MRACHALSDFATEFSRRRSTHSAQRREHRVGRTESGELRTSPRCPMSRTSGFPRVEPFAGASPATIRTTRQHDRHSLRGSRTRTRRRPFDGMPRRACVRRLPRGPRRSAAARRNAAARSRRAEAAARRRRPTCSGRCDGDSRRPTRTARSGHSAASARSRARRRKTRCASSSRETCRCTWPITVPRGETGAAVGASPASARSSSRSIGSAPIRSWPPTYGHSSRGRSR